MTLHELLELVKGRVVGGAVRNKVLGLPINDYDIATPLLPQEVTHLALKAGLSVKPLGIEHGTVLVLTGDATYEITTLREDIETDGRHALVKFGTSWEKDAARRDFTINALSEDAQGKIYDYFEGLKDIKQGLVRFIGVPETRIKEDYLRILRFFRFTAQLSKSFDKKGLEACITFKTELNTLSSERIWSELSKILALPNYLFALEIMFEHSFLNQILGMSCELSHIQSQDPLLRLASLCVNTKEDVTLLREKLKLNNAETRRLETLASGWHFITPSLSQNEAKEMLFKWGKRSFQDRVLLAQTRLKQDLSPLLELATHWSIPHFPLSGQDLLKEGLKQGEGLGQELLKRKEAWIKNGFKYTR